MRLKQHHAWLFAFTDLAFLLLISLSLIPSAPGDIALHLAAMDVPSVPENSNLSPIHESKELWELHILYGGKSDTHPTPFKLARVEIVRGRSTPVYHQYLQRDELLRQLELLEERHIRPVLLASKTSLTHDFLFAAGAIAKAWDNTGPDTIVKPVHSEKDYQQ
jgi:hypothetical protein